MHNERASLVVVGKLEPLTCQEALQMLQPVCWVIGIRLWLPAGAWAAPAHMAAAVGTTAATAPAAATATAAANRALAAATATVCTTAGTDAEAPAGVWQHGIDIDVAGSGTGMN
jgi:hypothetical protein